MGSWQRPRNCICMCTCHLRTGSCCTTTCRPSTGWTCCPMPRLPHILAQTLMVPVRELLGEHAANHVAAKTQAASCRLQARALAY
eukprot:8818747-Lingulodinium_polyedra.AAC.1